MARDLRCKLSTLEYRTDNHGTRVYLVGRREDLLRDITETIGVPYCYIKTQDRAKCSRPYERTSLTTMFGEEVIRIPFKHPSEVRRFRDQMRDLGVYTYESDIRFRDVYLRDSGILSGYTRDGLGDIRPVDALDIPLLVLYLDIEVGSSKVRTPCPNSRDPIVCCTLEDSYTHRRVTYYLGDPVDLEDTCHCSSEKELLENITREIQSIDPDIITGWFTSTFDLPYIINRMRQLGLDTSLLSPLGFRSRIEKTSDGRSRARIYGRNVIGLEEVYSLLRGTSSLKLDEVAKLELGYGKLEFDREKLGQWSQNIEEIIHYNIRDVELVVELDTRLQLLELLDLLRCLPIFGVRLDTALSPFASADMAFLRYARSQGLVLPNSRVARVAREYTGAIVLDPKVGIHHNVALLDFRVLYPSVIRAFNISPDTFSPRGDIIIDQHHRFDSRSRGIVPGLLDMVASMRDEIEEEARREEARGNEKRARTLMLWSDLLKRRQNSLYGILGNPVFRLYSPKVAEAITLKGRQLIQYVKGRIEEKGYSVVYGDTDGLFIVTRGLEEGFQLEREINSLLEHEVSPEVRVKMDCFFSRLILLKKKRYLGKYVYYKGEYKTGYYQKGLETVRTDVPRINQVVLDTLARMILDGEEDRVEEYLYRVKEQFQRREISLEDLGVPTILRKPLEEYLARCQRCDNTLRLDPEKGLFQCSCGYTRKPSSQVRAYLAARYYLNLELEPGMPFYRYSLEHPSIDIIGVQSPDQLPTSIQGYPVRVDYSRVYQDLMRDIRPLASLVNIDFSRLSLDSVTLEEFILGGY